MNKPTVGKVHNGRIRVHFDTMKPITLDFMISADGLVNEEVELPILTLEYSEEGYGPYYLMESFPREAKSQILYEPALAGYYYYKHNNYCYTVSMFGFLFDLKFRKDVTKDNIILGIDNRGMFNIKSSKIRFI